MTSKKKEHYSEPETGMNEQESPQSPETQAPEIDPLEAMTADRDDWKDKYLRSMAEFENFRRRTNQEKSDWIKRSTEHLSLEICDVLDNFERALAHTSQEGTEDAFVKGILLIEKQLRSVLERQGIKKIEALGADFDPEYHDALAHIPSDLPENKVAAIIQNGYTMHDKVIRHVKVAVSKGNETIADIKINTEE